MHTAELKKIPAVDKLLTQNKIIELTKQFGSELVVYSIRQVLQAVREDVLKERKTPEIKKIIKKIELLILSIAGSSLKSVINATGIVLHTNLGRAPLGKAVLKQMEPIINHYSNLELNLQTGKRGHRKSHVTEMIKFITKAEDAVVVNNNAAGIMLCLKTLAFKKEVIISRGELIEIGGSFRIPEILKASGAKMKEVGTTNRTRISDYENAITEKTRIIFKAHKSNFHMTGFTEEVEISKLSKLAKKNNLVLIYDIGSGLLRKPECLALKNEPDVRSSLNDGTDLITFSCDKLLGGPQAGIIAGKNELISKIARTPMMRALRVGKMTLAVLSSVLKFYLKDEDLFKNVPIFMMLNRDKEKLKNIARNLSVELNKKNIKNKIIESFAQVGGGTLPDLRLESFAVCLVPRAEDNKFAEKIFKKLLRLERPILGVLREGNFLLDIFTIFEEDIPYIAEAVKNITKSVEK